MPAGPRPKITAEPLSFKGWPRDRAQRRMRFIRNYIITPRGHGGGKPFKLRDFQKEIITGAFAPGVRTSLVSMPRGNGKSALAAALGLAELFVGELSAQVIVVASDQRQASIILNFARRMVELNPELAARVQVFRDYLYVPENDATFMPLPADYNTLQGWDPTLQIVDELHVVTPDVWEAVTSAAGKREESLTLAISTPADNKDSVMWGLVQYARTQNDPTFYFKEFSAPDGCDIADREAWRQANPAMSCNPPFLAEDALESLRHTIREPRFRQLRLGQWSSQVDAWLPFDVWEKLRDPAPVPDGERIVLGFDGSASGDSTALIGCTVSNPAQIFVAGVWEQPEHSRDWRVPREEVLDRIDLMFEKYEVVELAADPWGWRTEMEHLAKTYGERRVIEFNTAFRKKMGPATDRFYQAVMEERLHHDGNDRLAIHISNAIATETAQGTVITKDERQSKRKIDLAVAAILAHERAAFHVNKPRRRVASF